jgi:hypothetical protein
LEIAQRDKSLDEQSVQIKTPRANTRKNSPSCHNICRDEKLFKTGVAFISSGATDIAAFEQQPGHIRDMEMTKS